MAQPVYLHSVSVQIDVESLPVHSLMVALVEREADMHVIVQTFDGDEAVSAWQAHELDAGLIDLSMPVLDGFGAIAAIRRMARRARLVVMSTICGNKDAFRAAPCKPARAASC